MTSLQGKSAVVIGGSSGLGESTVKALLFARVRVTAIARSADRLRALEENVGEGLSTLQGDATDPVFVERLLRELKPDLVVLAAGATPRMGRIDEFEWESFSEPWNIDVKASFLLVKQALTLPLSPSSSVVLVSSGAAIDGSPLSGGYAGAKRMQWFLADYAQKASNAKKLGVRFFAVLPRPMEGTTIGARAAAAYGAMSGITSETFMKRVGVPVEKVASAILTVLSEGVPAEVCAIAVTRAGIEPLT
jgi:NAD(P)-dependent dehydrogenase (short-subunit alcohol dehydrogenase family)